MCFFAASWRLYWKKPEAVGVLLRLDFLCVLLIAFDSIYHMASNIMYLHIGSKGLSMYELTVPPILSLLTTLFVFQSTAVNPRRCAHLGFSFSCSNTSRSSFNSIMNHEQKKHLNSFLNPENSWSKRSKKYKNLRLHLYIIYIYTCIPKKVLVLRWLPCPLAAQQALRAGT